MKKILAAMALAITLTLGACQTVDVKVSTRYVDPDTGAVVWIVYEDSEVSGYLEYNDPDSGLITKVEYTRDTVTGNITYRNPETGLETTIEIGNTDEERG